MKASARTWPRHDSCPGCGADVLEARDVDADVRGRPYVLDAEPVLPLGKCGHCTGSGEHPSARGSGVADARQGSGLDYSRKVPCQWCAGTGKTGEPLTIDVVLVDETGRVRLPERRYGRRIINPRSGRRSGEAAYRRHRCTAHATRCDIDLVAEGVCEVLRLAEALEAA